MRVARAWSGWWGKVSAAALALALMPAAAAASAGPAPAAAVSTPRPALWLLEDEDTKVYLFGTIHILPPGFKWRSAALDRVVESADELVVETYEQPGDDAYLEAAALFFAETPSPIIDRVPADQRAALLAAIAAGPLPAEMYDELQTWAAAIMLGLAGLLGDYGVDDVAAAPGVEDVLEELFRAAGKPIGSVEDPVAILQDMNALAPEAQAELLVQAVAGLTQVAGAKDFSNEAWVAGRAEQMEVPEAELGAGVYDVLVRKRNAAWVEWLAQRLERPGAVLFAVGAGHLAGPDSVQRMLAERGLTVRRID